MVDLSVKYSVDGPEVLNKISFEIKPNERVSTLLELNLLLLFLLTFG